MRKKKEKRLNKSELDVIKDPQVIPSAFFAFSVRKEKFFFVNFVGEKNN